MDAGLALSLRIQGQRRELSAMAARLGVPLLFLKGAWADPVLYGGRGERWCGDIDILVPAAATADFAAALSAAGYRPREVAGREALLAAAKARLWYAPGDGLPVDLHHGLSNAPWFALDAAACIGRAIPYESVDGPILSLGPADQILFAALHYAHHGLELDPRHIEDIRRLIARFPPDWQALARRARAGHFAVGLAYLCEALGVDAIPPTWSTVARLRAAQRLAAQSWIPLHPRHIASLTLLSSRTTALPRYLLQRLRWQWQ